MILEHVDIRILPGQQTAFEAAMARGLRTVHTRAKGMRSFQLHKCVESPDRYVMQICWERLEDHMAGYRQSPLSPEFRAIVERHFAQPPVMEHFSLVVMGEGTA